MKLLNLLLVSIFSRRDSKHGPTFSIRSILSFKEILCKKLRIIPRFSGSLGVVWGLFRSDKRVWMSAGALIRRLSMKWGFSLQMLEINLAIWMVIVHNPDSHYCFTLASREAKTGESAIRRAMAATSRRWRVRLLGELNSLSNTSKYSRVCYWSEISSSNTSRDA